MGVHRERQRGRAAIARQLRSISASSVRDSPAPPSSTGTAELEKSALAQQREIGGGELIGFVAAAVLLGEPRTDFVQNRAPIEWRRWFGVAGHGQTWDAPSVRYALSCGRRSRDRPRPTTDGRDISGEYAPSTMTETPPSFAETPGRPAAAGPDVLSEMLRAVRLTGSVFFGGSLHGAVRLVISPKRWDESTPDGASAPHQRLSSDRGRRCTFETATGSAARSRPATCCCCRSRTSTNSGTASRREIAYAPDLVQPGPIEGMWTVHHGGGGEETRLVCGYLEVVRIPVRAGVPHAAAAAGRARPATTRSAR